MPGESSHRLPRRRRTAAPERGHTLSEVLAVILIIVVLVGIAIPIYTVGFAGADRRAAELNSNIGDSVLEEAWFDIANEGGNDYLDYSPPGGLDAPSLVNARYMSVVEPRIYWSDLRVTDGRFRCYGVYKNGELVEGTSGPECYYDWSNCRGRIAVLQNAYWEDGAWRTNDGQRYATIITLDRGGTAHYRTYRQGSLLDSGTFKWEDGRGHPGGEG
ncbi:MAG: hypothetical protein KKF41_03790 [Actinobacteria bacterium]|nr:hypothetical protein [Actinomycetota bacterium]MBU1942129.1 hypothetical protein [Actinomycetota bacterium]MBU2686687.1 hypothetical protein [Actinomycetota bacterium]